MYSMRVCKFVNVVVLTRSDPDSHAKHVTMQEKYLYAIISAIICVIIMILVIIVMIVGFKKKLKSGKIQLRICTLVVVTVSYMVAVSAIAIKYVYS